MNLTLGSDNGDISQDGGTVFSGRIEDTITDPLPELSSTVGPGTFSAALDTSALTPVELAQSLPKESPAMAEAVDLAPVTEEIWYIRHAYGPI